MGLTQWSNQYFLFCQKKFGLFFWSKKKLVVTRQDSGFGCINTDPLQPDPGHINWAQIAIGLFKQGSNIDQKKSKVVIRPTFVLGSLHHPTTPKP